MLSRLFTKRKLLVVATLLAVVFIFLHFSGEEKVDFSSQVKPILNKNCITCHGGVRAKGGFSVLFREEALAKTESGKPAIIPGDPDGSEMIRRITLEDPEDRMPYKHQPLSREEIDILRRWVKQGAHWGEHWAYIPVQKTPVPDINDDWIRNDVDRFILDQLRKENLKPSPEADKATLLRRASLDLIGMYPSPEIEKRFLESRDDHAYETLVDTLLQSRHFGEKWASMWLDLARYADSKGYEADRHRDIWEYRDWVIRAFNKDMPYNTFITEQIAGDLLPNPTDADYIATGFSRNTMTNDEGGTDNEEFRTSAVLDRVNTTWEALMSTTFGCVQCHSHPYDPFRHDEYYKFVAYFNNTRDEDVPMDYPLLRLFNDTLEQEMETVVNWVKINSSEQKAHRVKKFLRTLQPSINSVKAEGLKNAAMEFNYGFLVRNNSVFRLTQVDLTDANYFIYKYAAERPGGILTLHLDSPDGPVMGTTNLSVQPDSQIAFLEIPPVKGPHDVYFLYKNPLMPANSDKINAHFEWFSFQEMPGKGNPGYEEQSKLYRKLVSAKTPTTPIMMDNPAGMFRQTHVFERGNMRTLGDKVDPAVPASLSISMLANAPKNRIGLAQWLTDKKNPLVPRTIVNRLWEQLFGTGIVETLEDMGTQGMLPTHQALLDHYSFELMNTYDWSLKKLIKEIVMSATYRQSSIVSDELKQKDPFNRWYARGPRFRLSSEQLRDQDLCITGVLSEKMFGPPVMPWQPEGIWNSPYTDEHWVKSKGEDQYRRAVYTYWKRSAPYPSMISFDAVQRVLCTVRRVRTNTPLQALVTLNDSVYIDMARNFARRMEKENPGEAGRQIEKGYELMLFKPIPSAKKQVFLDLYNKSLDEFRKDSGSAEELLGDGLANSGQAAEKAAMVVVANAMLNLDEVITKN